MPYGKYKGRLIADLPGNYLNWFAREGFPPGEIGRPLALMHEIDHNGLKSLLDPRRRRFAVFLAGRPPVEFPHRPTTGTPMETKLPPWPKGAKIAVMLTVMFE